MNQSKLMITNTHSLSRIYICCEWYVGDLVEPMSKSHSRHTPLTKTFDYYPPTSFTQRRVIGMRCLSYVT